MFRARRCRNDGHAAVRLPPLPVRAAGLHLDNRRLWKGLVAEFLGGDRGETSPRPSTGRRDSRPTNLRVGDWPAVAAGRGGMPRACSRPLERLAPAIGDATCAAESPAAVPCASVKMINSTRVPSANSSGTTGRKAPPWKIAVTEVFIDRPQQPKEANEHYIMRNTSLDRPLLKQHSASLMHPFFPGKQTGSRMRLCWPVGLSREVSP
jgi:hypothetical protein